MERVSERGLSISRFRIIAWLAFASLYIIIVTGSLVRLTGSGLGCVDWPACNEERFVDVSTPHAAIEQLNRLFTGVVAASVIAAMIAAFAVRPRDKRTVRLAALLVLGVVGQVVLGGIVVLYGFAPVEQHGSFLVVDRVDDVGVLAGCAFDQPARGTSTNETRLVQRVVLCASLPSQNAQPYRAAVYHGRSGHRHGGDGNRPTRRR